MKKITIEFTIDEFDVLDHISTICNKNTDDFIKEALFCLLPLNEYTEIKQNLVVLRNTGEVNKRKKLTEEITRQIEDVNVSAGKRLKRLGMLRN